MEESWTFEKASGKDSFIYTATEYKYDGFGNCTRIMQDFGGGESLSAQVIYDNTDTGNYIIGLPVDIRVYDSKGTLLRHRSGDYDGRGRLTELRRYFDSYNYSVDKFSYDSYGNIKSATDSRGATLSYTYDDDVNMFITRIEQHGKETDTYTGRFEHDLATQTKKSETDCSGNKLSYEYDSWQRVTEIRTSYDTGNTPAVSYEYKTPNNDSSGHHELWHAVTNNKVIFDADDERIIQTVIQIDGMGRAVRTAKTGFVNGRDGWNASGAVEYDSKGRAVKEGMTEFIEGDIQTLLESEPRMTSLFTAYEYDGKDRRTKTTLPDGSVQSAAFYIEENRLITETADPLGNIAIQETDSRGNIVRMAKKDVQGKLLTQATYRYNEMGEMLKAFDAKGNAVIAEYDLLGRRNALESKDSGRQEFFYDECSNLVRESSSVLRENNKQIVYGYDGLNRLVKIDYPDTEDTLYTYGGADASNGAAGKILSVTDASGTLEYEYGKLGEVTKETRTLTTHLNGSSPTETAVMEYRSDYLGRMQWIAYPDGEKVTYGYDRGGQVISVTGSNYGNEFNYVTNILYDQYGQRTRIDYGNGTFTEYNYDPAHRWLDTIKTQNKWGQAYQNISYSFDVVGNVLGYENDCLNSASGNYRTKQTYSYDSLYQLIKADGETTYNPYQSSVPEFVSTYSQSFSFDADGLGNMTSKVSSETLSPQKSIGDNLNYSFNYVYDDSYAHRLVRAGDRYYKYDSNGNITAEQDGSFESNGDDVSYHKITKETDNVYSTDYGWGLFREENGSGGGVKGSRYCRTYAWNERNQLISSVDSNYNTAYIYGKDGQRSNKYTQNSETLYFNKMWTLHTDSGNNIYGGQTAKNIYLGETRIVTKLNSGTNPTYQEEYYKQYYYHSDHLGSASLISDYKGDEYQRIEYTPYGETWVEKTSNTGLEWLPYKFTAKELDEETGLYYYGARYLDAKYSRWLSADPALGDYVSKTSKGEGGIYNSINLNLYHYSNNNPVKYTDPDGKFAVVPMLIGGAISVAVDYGFQVAGNYMQGKRGSDAWTDVNVGEIAGAFVSGALTTVGIGAVTKVAGTATSAAVRKGIQVAGNAAVSAATSVPGTITENAVNNLVNPDNKVALTENVKDNAIKSGISGGVVSALAKTPAMSVKTPKGYKPNNIPYKQVGPNKYVRKGPMPGSIQAGAVQLTKDVGGEIFGQGVSKEVSNIYDNIKNHKQPQNVENE
ncbi:RHS repeat-associated core domain-containing protein [uncultured Treponema sp.]|uniref:RHS repeat-associated core domain-containing protein n=1 Tax=uncultured Treponema sp. TaxID=162155 RepID=UPI0025968FB4|nr:RHS repeat-associated core domain-containing protein [uncultured Treponema sp.]